MRYERQIYFFSAAFAKLITLRTFLSSPLYYHAAYTRVSIEIDTYQANRQSKKSIKSEVYNHKINGYFNAQGHLCHPYPYPYPYHHRDHQRLINQTVPLIFDRNPLQRPMPHLGV